MQRRAPRSLCWALSAVAVTSVAAMSGLVGSLLVGHPVAVPDHVVALLSGWLSLVALVALVALRAFAVATHAGHVPVRTHDPLTRLARYEPLHDDGHVSRRGAHAGAVVVVEVLDHVTASAISPSVADRLLVDATHRARAAAAQHGAAVRRIDGPRLAVLVSGRGESEVIALAGTLHDGFSPRASRDLVRHGTASVRLVAGVAIADGESADVATLIRSASNAAAQAKRRGNGAPVVFHEGLAEEARERLVVGRALRAAIDARSIDLVYQPQVDLADGAFLGVEVLARWHDPVLGTIAPDRFVAIAAETGLSWQLDRLIFDKAFAQLSAWDAEGVAVPRLFLNVAAQNISVRRCVDLSVLLATYDIAPGRIAIELVHHGLADPADIAASVRQARCLGVHVLLDHVGAEDTCFDRLAELSVSGIKLDRSLLADRMDRIRLGAIVRAGASRGLSVIAVGIETAAQRDLVRALGCTGGQGYLYAPPLTADELLAWMRVPDLVA